MNGLLDLTRAQYDALKGENWSAVRHLAKSPAHYLAASRLNGKDTAAKKRGRAVHLAIFEPERFAATVVLWDGGRRAGKTWDAFEAEHAGREILTLDEMEEVRGLANAVRSDSVARKYLEGEAERSALWTHNVNGVEVACKGRFDLVGSHLVDLKTTRDASVTGFEYECAKYRTWIQCAWYRAGLELATGKRLPVALIAVEADYPHAVVVRPVPDELLDIGESEFQAYLRLLVACRLANSFPGYADAEVPLTIPANRLGLEEAA